MTKTFGFLLLVFACPMLFGQSVLTDTLSGTAATNLSAHTADTSNTWTSMSAGNLLLDGSGYVYATGTAQNATYKASGTTFSVGSTLVYTCSFNILSNGNYASIGATDAAGNAYLLTSLSSTYATGSGFQIEKASSSWITSAGASGTELPVARSSVFTPSGIYTATFIISTDGTTVTMNATVSQAGAPVWSSGNVIDTFYPTVNQAAVRGYATTPGSVTTGHHVGNLSAAVFGGMAASPDNLISGGVGYTVHLTGGSGSWTSGTTFFVSTGTITAQTVTSPTTATLTYNAPGGLRAIVVSDSVDSARAVLYTYSVPVADGGSFGIGTSTPIGSLDIEALDLNQYGHLIVNRPSFQGLGGEVTIRNTGGGTGAAGALAFEIDNSTAFNLDGSSGANAEIRAINRNGSTNATDLLFTNWTGTAEQTNLAIQGTTGNVGVGTLFPGAKLEVNGGIKLSSGSTGGITFADGTTQGSAYPGGVAGVHNLGLGTTTPNTWSGASGAAGSNLQVYAASAQARVIINSATGNPELHLIYGAGAAGHRNHLFYADANGLTLNQPADDYSSSALNMYWANTGNVGIGTSSPGAKLEVNGGIKFSTSAGTSGTITFPDGSSQNTAYIPGSGGIGADIHDSGGNVGIGSASPTSPLLVTGAANQVGSTSSPIIDVVETPTSCAGCSSPGLIGERILMNQTPGAGSTNVGLWVSATNGTAGNIAAIFQNGDVGIGTTSPGAKLDVSGNVKISGTGASLTFPDSTVQATAWTGTLTGGDYAESVDVTGDRNQFEPGDVLVVDPDHSDRFIKATEEYSTLVAGVYSTKPGVIGRHQTTGVESKRNEVPMAMVGIVPTKVTARNGAIHRGDLLVASSVPGYAMKGSDRAQLTGAVIGKALEQLDAGDGLIEVLISLQ